MDNSEVTRLVEQPLWEPRHEWESRVKFVEDYLPDYGLEKAINLSLVWANMNFLGCSYPPGTESLVKSYPLPSLEELAERRKKTSFKPATTPSESFAEVSALLSSARMRSSVKATHPQIQTIANEMCLCTECLGQAKDMNESSSRKGVEILESYKKIDKSFKHELMQKLDQQSEGWTLVLNGEVVLDSLESVSHLMGQFVRILHNWQEANQKPPCPALANQQVAETISSGYPYPQQPRYGGRSEYGGADHYQSGTGYHQHGNYEGGGSYQGNESYQQGGNYQGGGSYQGNGSYQQGGNYQGGSYHGSPGYADQQEQRSDPRRRGFYQGNY